MKRKKKRKSKTKDFTHYLLKEHSYVIECSFNFDFTVNTIDEK